MINGTAPHASTGPAVTPAGPWRVAVIGSGPSGFYAAEAALRSDLPIEVDMYEKLPTPHGLVRYGVAPDHQKLKKVSAVFDRIAAHPGFRFFGNVEVGADITLEELRRAYHAVVLATGAEHGKSLGIDGEDLPGSVSSRDFVAWYNGHPHCRTLDVDFSASAAVVIGNGNVALDVARMLASPLDDLAATDIADDALEALSKSRIRDIHIVGRRGPRHARFSERELREFLHARAWETVITGGRRLTSLPADADISSTLELFREAAARQPADAEICTRDGGRKRVFFHFHHSPVRISGTGGVASMTFSCPSDTADGERTFPCGLVVRCVGYDVCGLENVPLDSGAGTFRNVEGRVTGTDGTEAGLYVVGWAKRGAQGTIGTNRGDSEHTVAALLEDLPALQGPVPDREGICAQLQARGCAPVSYDDWKKLDAWETRVGAAVGRPRVKTISVSEMLEAMRVHGSGQ